jgi:hypothetical protein
MLSTAKLLTTAIANTALFTTLFNSISIDASGSSFSAKEISPGIYSRIGTRETLTSSNSLQYILWNTHMSDEYGYPTDITRDIMPVRF